GRTVLVGAAGAVLLAVFGLVESRHESPLVPPAFATRKSVLVPNAAISLQSMVGIAWLYVLTLYFQEVLGHGPFDTGLLFAPMTLAAVVAAPIGGRLATRFGLRATAVLGLTLVGAGLVAMVAGMSPTGSLTVVLGGMVVGEAGFMLSNVSLTAAGTVHGAEDGGGLAAGLLNTSTQLGNGWGLAIAAVVVASAHPGGGRPGAGGYADALRLGLGACLCFCALAVVVVLLGLRRHPAATAPT
ncbi:MAG: MFS transporter, partial [Actinomycetota bacterium]|nr:MFS transporter [Actinomycetota bacterium]